MSEQTPRMRGGAGRARTQRKSEGARRVDGGIRPEGVPLPKDAGDGEKSGKSRRQRKAAKQGRTALVDGGDFGGDVRSTASEGWVLTWKMVLVLLIFSLALLGLWMRVWRYVPEFVGRKK